MFVRRCAASVQRFEGNKKVVRCGCCSQLEKTDFNTSARVVFAMEMQKKVCTHPAMDADPTILALKPLTLQQIGC